MIKQRLTILVGNIGSGKSTLAKKLAKQGDLIVCRDDLRKMINGGEYKFIAQLEPAISKGARLFVKTLLEFGHNVIFDETNVTKSMRKNIIDIGKEFNCHIACIVMPRYSKEVCVDGRLSNNHGEYDKAIWEQVWEQFDKAYEEPTEDEGFDQIIKIGD